MVSRAPLGRFPLGPDPQEDEPEVAPVRGHRDARGQQEAMDPSEIVVGDTGKDVVLVVQVLTSATRTLRFAHRYSQDRATPDEMHRRVSRRNPL